MPYLPPPSFGIATAPQQVTYDEILAVWREADSITSIDHAWLFDHLLPISGDPNGPIFEGWTLLGALAAQTERLRLGVLVTSNRFRPPAMLAKIAATVDIVSRGRLEFGIGVGGRPDMVPREYTATGLSTTGFADGVASLAEACEVLKRLWTETEPFDFEGPIHPLAGAIGNPKPVQEPYPPMLIAGRSAAVLRIAARHADIWNIGSIYLEEAAGRAALLDRYCSEIGRDPSTIVRSLSLPASRLDPERTRQAIRTAREAGFSHFVLSVNSPYPEGVVQWLADEIIEPSR